MVGYDSVRSFGWGFGKSSWDLCSGPEGLEVARGIKQDHTASGVNRASPRKGWVVKGPGRKNIYVVVQENLGI